MAIEFKETQEGEISLPSWLAVSSLNLQEIGAIVTMACANETGGFEGFESRMGSPEMIEAMRSLKEKGVFKPEFSGGTIRLIINLEVCHV